MGLFSQATNIRSAKTIHPAAGRAGGERARRATAAPPPRSARTRRGRGGGFVGGRRVVPVPSMRYKPAARARAARAPPRVRRTYCTCVRAAAVAPCASKRTRACTRSMAPQSPDQRKLAGVAIDLAMYALSALISFALLNNVLKKLDPNESNAKQARRAASAGASSLSAPSSALTPAPAATRRQRRRKRLRSVLAGRC